MTLLNRSCYNVLHQKFVFQTFCDKLLQKNDSINELLQLFLLNLYLIVTYMIANDTY